MNVKSKILSFGLAAATMVSMIGATGAVTASAATAPNNVTTLNGQYQSYKNGKWYFTTTAQYNPQEKYDSRKFALKLTWNSVSGAEKYYIYKCRLNANNTWSFNRKDKPLVETNKTFCRISGLAPGKTYYYAILAYKDGLYSKTAKFIRANNYSPTIKMNFSMPKSSEPDSCAPTSIAWIAKYVKGFNYTPEDVYQIAQERNLMVDKGMYSDKIVELASKCGLKVTSGAHNINNNNLQDLRDVLDKQLKQNNPVIITGTFGVSNLYPAQGHAVVVVGKDFGTEKYYIADPFDGKLRTWDSTSKDFWISNPKNPGNNNVEWFYINR